jgi:hypothetical protein
MNVFSKSLFGIEFVPFSKNKERLLLLVQMQHTYALVLLIKGSHWASFSPLG